MKKIGTVLLLGLVGIIILGFAKPGLTIGEREQPLIKAVVQNDLSAVQKLVQQGADINAQDSRGRTALLAAVEGNHIECAFELIAAAADVNVQDDKMDSPLLLAGAAGTLEILKFILQAKPDFAIYNRYGGTPLIPACERGHVEVVKTFLNTNADIDHVNNLGWTALLEAIILSDGGPRHQEIFKLLVDAGANVNIGDHEGVTPLIHVRQKGFENIVRILRSAGAR